MRITTSLLATVFAIVVAFGNVFAGGHKKSKKEWSAEIGQSQVTIKHEGKTVSVVRTGLPNVEETRFLEQDGRKMLAVKSRGEHGPALLQLFDVQTGALKGFCSQGRETGLGRTLEGVTSSRGRPFFAWGSS